MDSRQAQALDHTPEVPEECMSDAFVEKCSLEEELPQRCVQVHLKLEHLHQLQEVLG